MSFLRNFGSMVDFISGLISSRALSEEQATAFDYAIDFLHLPSNVSVPVFEAGSPEPNTLLEKLEEILRWREAFHSLTTCGVLNDTFGHDWRDNEGDREVVLYMMFEKVNSQNMCEKDYGSLRLISNDRAVFNLENPPFPVPAGEYNWREALEMAKKIDAAISAEKDQ